MGMIGNLYRLTTVELEEILKDSSLLETKVYSDEGLGKDHLDLDKSWEGIIFILTGTGLAELDTAKPPLSWAFFSGQTIDDDQDLGYGPAQYIDASQVKQLNAALEKISAEDLKQKYNGKQMDEAGVYPEVWGESGSVDYLIDYFIQLKDFYKSAADQHQAVISFIN